MSRRDRQAAADVEACREASAYYGAPEPEPIDPAKAKAMLEELVKASAAIQRAKEIAIETTLFDLGYRLRDTGTAVARDIAAVAKLQKGDRTS